MRRALIRQESRSTVLTNMKLDYRFRVLVDTSSSITVIVDIPGKRLAYHVLKKDLALSKRLYKQKQKEKQILRDSEDDVELPRWLDSPHPALSAP